MTKRYRIYLLLTITAVSTSLLLYAYNQFKYGKITTVANNHAVTADTSYTLELIRTVSLDMDSVTDPNSLDYFQLYREKGAIFLSFLNNATDNIYFYNLSTRQLCSRISLEDYNIEHREKTQGYFLLNSDSLLLYTYEDAKIHLISKTRGRLMSKTIGFDSQTGFQNVYPYVSGRTPIYFDASRNKVYLSGFYSDEGGGYELDKEKNVLAVFGLQNSTVNYKVHYPDFYWGHNWGGAGGYRQAYIMPDEKNGNVVVSFMASHHLCVYNENTGAIAYPYAGSRYINNIKSLPYSTNYYDFLNIWDIYNYYLTNPSYSTVLYDKYQNHYYRIAELPLSSKIYYKTKQQKPKTLIILDRQFTILGELRLPEGLAADKMLISEEGIYFKKDDGNENRLTFELVRIHHL